MDENLAKLIEACKEYIAQTLASGGDDEAFANSIQYFAEVASVPELAVFAKMLTKEG